MVDRSSVEKVLRDHNYVLRDEIGQGSFGAVYRVESTKYEHVPFVLKIMEIHGDVSQETEILRGLCHPNIISMYDYFLDGDLLYVILEYCPGGSLADYVREHGPLRGHELVWHASQILSALLWCHKHQIAHRDIKPENILIDNHGRSVLADFGLSCRVGHGEEDESFSGSRAYMAPEVLARKRRNAFLADIWSVGVTFYVISTGKFPFPTDNAVEFLEATHRAELEFPSFVDPRFAMVVQQMVRFEPTQRIPIEKALDTVLLIEKEENKSPGMRIRMSTSVIRVPFKDQKGKISKTVPLALTPLGRKMITGFSSTQRLHPASPAFAAGLTVRG